MALFTEAHCLVELTQRVKGHPILCGHPKETCSQPKHRALQGQLGRRGRPGCYQQLPIKRNSTVDAVGDTYVSPEDWATQQQQNREMLAQLGQAQSAGKTAMEDALKQRSDPVVRIDTTPRGPRAERVQNWARDLPETPRHQEPPEGDTTVAVSADNNAIAAPVLVLPVRQPQLQKTPPTIATPPQVPLPTVPQKPADPSGGDTAMITLLSKLVDKVEALTTSHDTVLQTSTQM
jgi:hypothetical protein